MTSPQQEQRPPDRARQARIMNRINVVMRFVLSLPFPTPLSGRLMLLRLTGWENRTYLPNAGQLHPP